MNRARGPAVSAALAMWWLVAVSATAPAQAPRNPRLVFTNRVTFSLPVKIDERDRAELKELKFFVRSVQSGVPGEWVCRESAAPTQTRFAFQAPQDGEYWFAFATVDRAGNVVPADLDREPPGLVVIVDTKAPEIDVRPMKSTSGDLFLQCQVQDANPDLTSLKLEYLAGDKSWHSLSLMPDVPGLFRVPSADVFHGLVRASAIDRAGNKATREIDLSQPPVAPPQVVAEAAVTGGPMLTMASAPITTAAVTSAPASSSAAPASPAPIVPAVPAATQAPALTPAPAQTTASASGLTTVSAARVVEKSTAPVQVRPKQNDDGSAPTTRVLINSFRCSLEYAVDTANVERVEVYATRDSGRSWSRVVADSDRRSPITFALAEDGVYGVTLVVTTMKHPGTAPAPGDLPDLWLEIDTTKPDVLVHGVEAGTGAEARILTVNWSVQDRNLSPDSVEVLGATGPEGPWQPLVRGLKDKGTVQCAVPTDLGSRVFLRVQASDKAGNIGRWESREPVPVDGAKPKARVLGVSAGH